VKAIREATNGALLRSVVGGIALVMKWPRGSVTRKPNGADIWTNCAGSIEDVGHAAIDVQINASVRILVIASQTILIWMPLILTLS
jgi:hypothetical protein